MNLELKRAGPSYPQDIDWGFQAFCKYLDKHPEYEIAEGDILIFVVGRFSDDLSALPFGIYSPDGGIRSERAGVSNPENYQSQTHELRHHTTHYPLMGFYNS